MRSFEGTLLRSKLDQTRAAALLDRFFEMRVFDEALKDLHLDLD
jgi:hypothetical protein